MGGGRRRVRPLAFGVGRQLSRNQARPGIPRSGEAAVSLRFSAASHRLYVSVGSVVAAVLWRAGSRGLRPAGAPVRRGPS
jgi:hypothetical protein